MTLSRLINNKPIYLSPFVSSNNNDDNIPGVDPDTKLFLSKFLFFFHSFSKKKKKMNSQIKKANAQACRSTKKKKKLLIDAQSL